MRKWMGTRVSASPHFLNSPPPGDSILKTRPRTSVLELANSEESTLSHFQGTQALSKGSPESLQDLRQSHQEGKERRVRKRDGGRKQKRQKDPKMQMWDILEEQNIAFRPSWLI
ncbi:uncharacterized protein LOC106999014 isoform X2 [Macaca mulatta]